MACEVFRKVSATENDLLEALEDEDEEASVQQMRGHSRAFSKQFDPCVPSSFDGYLRY